VQPYGRSRWIIGGNQRWPYLKEATGALEPSWGLDEGGRTPVVVRRGLHGPLVKHIHALEHDVHNQTANPARGLFGEECRLRELGIEIRWRECPSVACSLPVHTSGRRFEACRSRLWRAPSWEAASVSEGRVKASSMRLLVQRQPSYSLLRCKHLGRTRTSVQKSLTSIQVVLLLTLTVQG
jgi:hypothetical protein